MNSGEIYFAEHDHACVFKLVGEVRYTMSCSLDELLEQKLNRAGLDNVYIDLCDATSIDSTSLGLLAKIANFMRERNDDKVILMSSNDDINQILHNMGFDEIFELCACDGQCPKALHSVAVDEHPAKEQMAKTVFEAHRILSDLNDHNRLQFKQVLGTLKKQLQRVVLRQ